MKKTTTTKQQQQQLTNQPNKKNIKQINNK